MQFSFSAAKQASNLKKHGFDLADARPVMEPGQTVLSRIAVSGIGDSLTAKSDF